VLEIYTTRPNIFKHGVKEASPRLAYYASKLPDKDTWFQTDEGYRIYKNVPIARTGSQEYLGREIKKNSGYDSIWNIGDHEIVTVYRPLEEVTSAETLASFEGKSTLDEHPADPQVLINALDEYEGVSCGHATNIRIGETLEDGETSIIADLWVKHPELNMKIDGGVRDVSCGYTFLLDKDSAGRYIMKKIRGNHVAVVPKGRAGSDVGIKDAALNRRFTMAKPNRIFRALGFQAWAKDAKPEEIADALEGMEDSDEVAKKAAEKEEAARDKAAKDKAAKDKAAKDADKEHDPDDAECDCKDCKAAKDAVEKGKDEMTDADKLEEEEKKDKKEEEKEAAKDLDALVLPSDEHSKSEFSVGDAAKNLLAMKSAIAKSKDKGATDAFNSICKTVRTLKSGVKDGAVDPFKMLVNIASGVNDASIEEIPINQFFSGKSHAEGLKAYNKYQEDRATARR